MDVKKRKKRSRHRGTHTHGRGAKKKARGSGHRGGVGKAGTGKRADQKKSMLYTKIGKTLRTNRKKYFGTDKVRRAASKIEAKIISLENIMNDLDSYVKKGLATINKGVYEFNLHDYKIIGNANMDVKLKINAGAASKGALEAIKKSGGEIVIHSGKSHVGVKLDEKEQVLDAEVSDGDESMGVKVENKKGEITAEIHEGKKKAGIKIAKKKNDEGYDVTFSKSGEKKETTDSDDT